MGQLYNTVYDQARRLILLQRLTIQGTPGDIFWWHQGGDHSTNQRIAFMAPFTGTYAVEQLLAGPELAYPATLRFDLFDSQRNGGGGWVARNISGIVHPGKDSGIAYLGLTKSQWLAVASISSAGNPANAYLALHIYWVPQPNHPLGIAGD